MSELSYQSPLAGVAEPMGLAVSLREITDRGMIDLRGLTSDGAFMEAARSVLGVALPTTPRTSATWGDVRVLWLSVDQWLILSTRSKAQELIASLRAALQGIHALAVDVSDMRAVIRMEGEASRAVLMKGTSLDLLSGISPPAPAAACASPKSRRCCMSSRTTSSTSTSSAPTRTMPGSS